MKINFFEKSDKLLEKNIGVSEKEIGKDPINL